MGTLLEMKGDTVFKTRAYQRAARTIGQLSFPLEKAVQDGMDPDRDPGYRTRHQRQDQGAPANRPGFHLSAAIVGVARRGADPVGYPGYRSQNSHAHCQRFGRQHHPRGGAGRPRRQDGRLAQNGGESSGKHTPPPSGHGDQGPEDPNRPGAAFGRRDYRRPAQPVPHHWRPLPRRQPSTLGRDYRRYRPGRHVVPAGGGCSGAGIPSGGAAGIGPRPQKDQRGSGARNPGGPPPLRGRVLRRAPPVLHR